MATTKQQNIFTNLSSALCNVDSLALIFFKSPQTLEEIYDLPRGFERSFISSRIKEITLNNQYIYIYIK